MDSGIELDGADDFMKQIINMGEQSYPAIKKALAAGGDIIKRSVVPKIPRSSTPRQPSKGGKGTNSWRTGKHAADNITRSKVLGKDGNFYVLIGISKGDMSEYFYLKFIEYGTSTQAALAPFGRTVAETKNEVMETMTNILKEELGL